MRSQKQTIAIFDFDGTITRFDSLNFLIITTFGHIPFYLYMISQLPLLGLYKLNLTSNQQIKQNIFSYFFNNWSLKQFNDLCQKFAQTKLPEIINPQALRKIKWHLKKNHQVVIISASPTNWLKPWTKSNKIPILISSELESRNNFLTGKFRFNCYGSAKLTAFLKVFPNRSLYKLYVYGDSKGDRDLLKIADFKFYKNFKNV